MKVATQYFIYSVYKGGLKMACISRCIRLMMTQQNLKTSHGTGELWDYLPLAVWYRADSAVSNVSDCRYMSDCRPRVREYDPGPIPYFRGD